jgi:ankyrin repeat protein
MITFKQFLRYLFEATEEQKYNQYKQMPYETYKKILLGDKVYEEDEHLYRQLGFSKVDDMVWSQIQPTKIDKDGYVQQVGHRAIWVLDLWKKDKFEPSANDGHELMEIYRSFSLYNIYKKKLREETRFSSISDAGKINSRSELMDINHYITQTFLNKNTKNVSNVGTDVDVIYEDNEWLILIPLTWRASQKYGRDIIKSNWCTASSNSSHYYNRYMATNDLYIFYNKLDPEKSHQMGFHKNEETPEFNNNKNSPVNIDKFKNDNPDLKNTIDEILKEWYKINENRSYQEQKILERFKRTRSPNIPYQILRDNDSDENSKNLAVKMLDILTPNELKSNFLIDEYQQGDGEMNKVWGNFLIVTQKYPELFKKILELGADINVKDKDGETPLYGASFYGRTEIVSLLLQKGADINVKDKDGETPLYGASQDGNKEIVSMLLQKGADTDIADKNSRTPLYWASSRGHKEIVSMLLQKGADTDIADKNSRTPLYWASFYGRTEIVSMLLQNGADINVKDKDGQTPLYQASLDGNKEIVSMLLQKGADPNIANKNGQTPLYRASSSGHKEIVSMLLQKDADINVKDDDGQTPLYGASFYGHTEIVSLLLQNGADTDIANKNGQTPLYRASSRGHKEIVDLLKKHGAKE